MLSKVICNSTSGFPESFFFLKWPHAVRDNIRIFRLCHRAFIFRKLQNSQQREREREIIAIVNTFRFNSTCLLVNSVIHLWIGRLFNDNWINVNNVKPSLFPLIYHLGMWSRSTCNTKGGGVGWQTKFKGVESSVRFCQRSSLIDNNPLMKEWALGSVGY